MLIRQGKRTWRADIEKTDKRNDLAILAVVLRPAEPFDLPAAVLRDSTAVAVGERAYAIGTPRGLDHTLSDGLVSGRHTIGESAVIQTTAAISPGSSGGGLFDERAFLIGITTAFMRDGQNLNFAIPAEAVRTLQKDGPAAAQPEYAFPAVRQSTQPAANSSAPPTRTTVPLALGHVPAVVVIPILEGPVSSGRLGSNALTRDVTAKLRAAGILAFESTDAARKADRHAVPLFISISSMLISDSYLYPWQVEVSLMDTTDDSRGETRLVTIWETQNFGYGGSQVVTAQVADEVDRQLDRFIIALLGARSK